MSILRHSEWKETKWTLHLISQLLGKIRLALAPPEPQWGHVSLPLTARGFSTGLLEANRHVVQVDVDLIDERILVLVDETTDWIPLRDGQSIRFYYETLFTTLHTRDVDVTIHPVAQEVAYTARLDEDDTPLSFESSQAIRGLRLFQQAAHTQLRFLSRLRCRKVKPALFWGTFDVSSLLIWSRDEPYPENKVIERVAFDEPMIEFGFWLGDETFDSPTYFVLPYPFLFHELPTSSLRPNTAYYDAGRSEFFLELTDVLDARHVQQFFETTTDVLFEQMKWPESEHLFRPLRLNQTEE